MPSDWGSQPHFREDRILPNEDPLDYQSHSFRCNIELLGSWRWGQNSEAGWIQLRTAVRTVELLLSCEVEVEQSEHERTSQGH